MAAHMAFKNLRHISLAALAVSLAACGSKVDNETTTHEAVSYTHLTLPTNREV